MLIFKHHSARMISANTLGVKRRFVAPTEIDTTYYEIIVIIAPIRIDRRSSARTFVGKSLVLGR